MISIRALYGQNLCKRSLGKISAHISTKSLLAKPLDKIFRYSIKDLLVRSLSETSVQTPYKSSLDRNHMEGALGKISATDLYTMSLYKVSLRGVLAKCLYKISRRALCKQDLCKETVGKISTHLY
jgi:hypothetical protein